MLRRVMQEHDNTPRKDWQGVVEMRTKSRIPP
jgi:hypothetical protein